MKLWLKGKDGRWKFYKNASLEDLERRNITVGKFVTIGDMAMIDDRTTIGNWTTIGNGTTIGYMSKIGDGTTIGNRSAIGDMSTIGNETTIGDVTTILDRTTIGNWTTIGNRSAIGDMSTIGDRTTISDWSTIGKGATIAKTLDCIVVGPIGSRTSMLTGYLREREIYIGTGDFTGTLEDFRKEVKDKHGGTDIGRDYFSALNYIESRMKIALKA